MAPKAKPEAKAKAKADAKAKAAPKKEKAPAEEDPASKIPVVEKPDGAVFEERINKIQTEIDNLQRKQKEISNGINERSSGKEEFFQKKQEIRAQLDEFKVKIDALQNQKNAIFEASGQKRQETMDAKNELNKLKKTIGYTSEADIDDRIAAIEYQLQVESLSLKEEKKLMAEISDLKKKRPSVAVVNKKEGELAAQGSGVDTRASVGDINAQLAVLRDARRKVSDSLTELMDGRTAALGDLPDKIKEREDIGKKIQELIKQRSEVRDEKRAAEQEYNNYMNEVRRARQQKYADDRQKKQEEYALERRKRQAEQLDDEPYVFERTLLDQTIVFCRSLVATKDEEQKTEKKEIEHNNPEGTEVLKRKGEDEDWYYTPTAKGKKGKAKKNSGGEGNSSSRPIKHNAETFKLFDQLKLNAPVTTGEIPAMLEQLEKQQEDYKEKIKVWAATRDEKKKQILAGNYKEEEEVNDKKEDEAEGEAPKDDAAEE